MSAEIRPALLHNTDGIRTPEQVRHDEAERYYIDHFRTNLELVLGENSTEQNFSVDSQSLMGYLESRKVRFPHTIKNLRGESVSIKLVRSDEEMRPVQTSLRRYSKVRMPASWKLEVAGPNMKGYVQYEFGMDSENPYQPQVAEKQGQEVLRTGIHTPSDLMFANAVAEYIQLGVSQDILHSWLSVGRHPIGE